MDQIWANQQCKFQRKQGYAKKYQSGNKENIETDGACGQAMEIPQSDVRHYRCTFFFSILLAQLNVFNLKQQKKFLLLKLSSF